MTNSLIKIPNWTPGTIYFLKKYDFVTMKRGIKHGPVKSRTYPMVHDLIRIPSVRFKFNKYFSKFLTSKYKTRRFKNNKTEFISYLYLIKKIKNNNYGLCLDKFITTKFEEFRIECYNTSNQSNLIYVFKVEYDEIREPIINFLKAKTNNDKEIKELKQLFVNNNESGDFETYLNEKRDYLLNLDLDDYVKKMNTETENKKNILRGVKN